MEILDNYASDATEENEIEESIRRKLEICMKAKSDILDMAVASAVDDRVSPGFYSKKLQKNFANLIETASNNDLLVRDFKKLVGLYVEVVRQSIVETNSLVEFRQLTANIVFPKELKNLTENDDILSTLDDYVWTARNSNELSVHDQSIIDKSKEIVDYEDQLRVLEFYRGDAQSSSCSSSSSGLSIVGTPALVGGAAAVSLILREFPADFLDSLSVAVIRVLREPETYPDEMEKINDRFGEIIATLVKSFPSLIVQTERVVGDFVLQRDEFLKEIFKFCLQKDRNFDRAMAYIGRVKIGDKTYLQILEEFLSEGTVYADDAEAGN